MRRLLGIILFLLLTLSAIGAIAYTKLDLILSHILTTKFKTSVRIEDIELSPMKDILLENLTLANPIDYPTAYALRIGSIAIEAPYKNYLEKVVSIDRIELTNITLTVDYLDNVTNWETLMNNIETDDDKSDSYAVIKKLTFNNLIVRIEGKDGKLKTLKIPKLTLLNVQTKGGELTRRLTQAILKEVIFNIKNLINIPLKMTQDAISNPVDTTLDGLKALNPFGK